MRFVFNGYHPSRNSIESVGVLNLLNSYNNSMNMGGLNTGGGAEPGCGDVDGIE